MKVHLRLKVLVTGFLLVLTGVLVGCGSSATATPVPPTAAPTAAPTGIPEPTEAAELSGDLLRGGLMYDKWWAALGADGPTTDQPLWATQTTNTRSGEDTWRCKECHGWDYKGVDGAYGSGSHLTGFPGVFASQEKPASEILEAMQGSTNPDHDFSDAMDEQALVDLALFVTQGQVDTDNLVNADKSSKGDAAQGEVTYEEVCAACHGPEGVAINFHGFDDPEYVTTIANGNPWEFIHKVRFGQPGWPMPSAVTNNWTDAEVADVLAYAQTLPEDVTLNLGGQLYDKWWVLVGQDEPTTDQPLWATQTTNERSGKDTWRCKECHGWDYQGADGAYGSGSHFTGFSGILDSASKSADELTAWLNGEANPDHDFSELGDIGMGALVTFIREETGDVSTYINDDKSANGDPARGKSMFEDTCASCHGVDGKELNFGAADDPEYVGTIARDNPWEFIHKVSFGQPGTPMPVGTGMGWTIEDIANLLSYAQTLPFE